MPASFGAITLPRPLQRHVDDLVQAFLHPPSGRRFDFTEPHGEPALAPADSVSWRVFKNPATLFIGGVTAVLLELALPRVRDGVWQHSTFRTDALARLRRTGLAAMVTVYGPRGKAEAMIAQVVRRHDRVTGHTSEGEPYHANDPELLNWVQATAAYGFLEAYHGYARPLDAAERDAFYAEGRAAARLYGAMGAPTSQQQLDALFATMQPQLAPSPIVLEFLDIMRHVPVIPAPARPLQWLMIKAAVEILPDWVRERLHLDASYGLRRWQRELVRAMAWASDRIVLTGSPAVQSCRRLGLPDDYVYRR